MAILQGGSTNTTKKEEVLCGNSRSSANGPWLRGIMFSCVFHRMHNTSFYSHERNFQLFSNIVTP
jgi:hypothetical protein